MGSGSRRADPQRTELLGMIPRPTTKRDLRKYLGAMGYQRKYIAQFAQIAKPLTDLTGKKMPNVLVWGEAQERAFCTLKNRLSDAQVLRVTLLDVPLCCTVMPARPVPGRHWAKMMFLGLRTHWLLLARS